MNTNKKIKLRKDIIHSKRKNEILITSIGEGKDEVFKIEGISIVFLEQLLSGKSFKEISQQIAQQYEADQKRIETDLAAFINDLIIKKIVEEE